jgi:hypothetical protein
MTQNPPDDGTDTMTGFMRDSRTPLQRFMDAKSPVKVIDDFPGSAERWAGFSFGIRALPVSEVQTATVDALRELTEKFRLPAELLFTSVSDEMREISNRVHILYRVLVSAEPPHERLFATADKLREVLEPDELHLLFERYMDWQIERTPVAAAKTLTEVMGVVEALGKGMAPSSALSGFDAATLRYIVTALAQERQALLTNSTSAPSSSTSPPSESDEFSVSHSGYSGG